MSRAYAKLGDMDKVLECVDNAINYDVSISAKKKLKNYNYNVTHIPYIGGHSVPPDLIQKIEKWINKLISK